MAKKQINYLHSSLQDIFFHALTKQIEEEGQLVGRRKFRIEQLLVKKDVEAVAWFVTVERKLIKTSEIWTNNSWDVLFSHNLTSMTWCRRVRACMLVLNFVMWQILYNASICSRTFSLFAVHVKIYEYIIAWSIRQYI